MVRQLVLAALLFAGIFPGAGVSGLEAGFDSVVIEMKRPGYSEQVGKYYPPYSAWWIEDEEGDRIRLISITYYTDDGDNLSTACSRSGYLPSLTGYYDRFGCPPDTFESLQAANCPDNEPPDAVTGCSEKIRPAETAIIRKSWDLKDDAGLPVRPGAYYLMYNTVAMDEDYAPSDEVFRILLTLGIYPFDTLIASPKPVVSRGLTPELDIGSIEVAFGGMTVGADTTAVNNRVVNVAPTPPTASRPRERGFCGNGSGLSAAFLILFIQLRKRIKGSPHRQKGKNQP